VGALRSALSAKLAENKLTVVDGWELNTHKTKSFRLALDKLEKHARTILLVGAGSNANFDRASRNLHGVTVVLPNALQPYDLLRHDHLMLSREAAERLNRALSATHAEAPVQIEAAPVSSPKAAPKAEAAAKPAAKASSKTPKVAKKPAAKKEKAKSKPKAKKD
jgi:hypothetical protein